MAEQVTLQFPDGAFSALRRSPAEFADEVKRAAVCKWYELGVISQSKAAELLGVSRVRLMELLAAYRIGPIQATPEELRGELDGESMRARRPEAIDLHNRTERP